MSLDGLLVRALVDEIRQSLLGGRLQRIYQPDAITLALTIYRPPGRVTLVLSVDPHHPSLQIASPPGSGLAPSPLILLMRKHLSGARLIGIEQRGWDRVITLHFEALDHSGALKGWDLVMEVLGTRSQVLLLDGLGLVAEVLRRRSGAPRPGEPYSPPATDKLAPDAPDFSAAFEARWELVPPDQTAARAVLSLVEGPGPVSAREVVWQAGYLPETPCRKLDDPCAAGRQLASAAAQLARQVAAGQTRPASATVAGRQIMAVRPLEHLGRVDWHHHDSALALVREVTSSQLEQARLERTRTRLQSALSARIKRVRRRLEHQQSDLASAGDPAQLRTLGELLTANLYRVSRGDRAVTVVDHAAGGQEVVIGLNPRLKPAGNAQEYFRRYRRAARTAERAGRQLAATMDRIRYLESLELAVEAGQTAADIAEVEAEMEKGGLLKPVRAASRRAPTVASAPRPLLFSAPSGQHIAVGKNNRQNEFVTFRWASPQDLWFHVKDVAGSHVVLRVASGTAPRADLEAAALLAAHFSRARSGGNVPVDYTRVGAVRRIPGATPGRVNYSGHRTLYVTPAADLLPRPLDPGGAPAAPDTLERG